MMEQNQVIFMYSAQRNSQPFIQVFWKIIALKTFETFLRKMFVMEPLMLSCKGTLPRTFSGEFLDFCKNKCFSKHFWLTNLSMRLTSAGEVVPRSWHNSCSKNVCENCRTQYRAESFVCNFVALSPKSTFDTFYRITPDE